MRALRITHSMVLVVAIAGLLACAPGGPPSVSTSPTALETSSPEDDRFDSFLRRHKAASSGERHRLLVEFVEEQQEHGGFPIVTDEGTASFVYVGDGASHEVSVIGDFLPKGFDSVYWKTPGIPMEPVTAQRHIYVARLRVEPDARLDCQFMIDGEAIEDPLNPRSVFSGIAGASASELVMPQYAFDSSIIADEAMPAGRVVVHEGLRETEPHPKLRVYLPPNYDASRPHQVLYTADGEAWETILTLPRTLDALITRGDIEPVIAVMIDAPRNRSEWYGARSDYATYLELATEFIEERYSCVDGPEHRVLVGSSAGARAALFVGFTRPDLFGGIGSFSASLHSHDPDHARLLDGTLLPDPQSRIWLSAGSYEGYIAQATHQLEESARRHAASVRAVYTHEGHSFGAWHNASGDLLRFFFGDERRATKVHSCARRLCRRASGEVWPSRSLGEPEREK